MVANLLKGEIGENSCDGGGEYQNFVGSGLGYSSACRRLTDVKIGNNACNGYAACACLEHGTVVPDGGCNEDDRCCGPYGEPLSNLVGAGSCPPLEGNGDLTENCLGARGPIGQSSCSGVVACQFSNAAIGSSSCVGQYVKHLFDSTTKHESY